jgi:hypothetical protein
VDWLFSVDAPFENFLKLREALMSLVKTWYTPEAAADKFGIKVSKLLEWVTEGLVRAEQEGEKIVQVNIDDVRIEVETMVQRS